MIELCRLIWCGLIGWFRSRASLEIEILALCHQLNILRRKSPKRPTLGSPDRLVFAGLYGLATGVLSALAIVRPETIIRRHLRHLLRIYAHYYYQTRTCLSLNKDSPVSRAVKTVGRILPLPILGGLHHRYVRI
jgi:hypothetical protein